MTGPTGDFVRGLAAALPARSRVSVVSTSVAIPIWESRRFGSGDVWLFGVLVCAHDRLDLCGLDRAGCEHRALCGVSAGCERRWARSRRRSGQLQRRATPAGLADQPTPVGCRRMRELRRAAPQSVAIAGFLEPAHMRRLHAPALCPRIRLGNRGCRLGRAPMRCVRRGASGVHAEASSRSTRS